MDCIKKVHRSAFVSFSPEAPFMATGTMAGAVDLSFSSSANLEIFELDFKSDDRDLKLVGHCSSSERFTRLAWGIYGLIAGGLVDGNISLWNSNRSESSSEIEHVRHLSKHQGSVRGLEFNSKSPNQLASGADDGTVCVWDLANPSAPSHYLKGTGSSVQEEISSVSWNREFQHVLASTSYNGTTVIWDVNNAKVITNFKSLESVHKFQGPTRCSVLQWDPDNFNQIMVASDEDSSPNLKLFDIRYLQSPVRTFVGHQRGVIAMEWCPSDSSYLLTCAKDNRTICWNTKTGKIVAELPTGDNCNFDVHWYPKIPGVISASSVDGKIGIYNLECCSSYDTEVNNLDSAPLTAPKWWKRPVGASFGFGGKLVSFNKNLPEASEVIMHSVATEQSLVNRISKFEAAIQNGDKSSLRGLCEKKTEETNSEEEKETWGLLKIMLGQDGTAKPELRTHLGFSIPCEEKLQTVKEPHATSFTENVDETQQMPEGQEEEEEEISDPTVDDAIQRSLVVGDCKKAVAQCLSANKMADALVIAHVGGTTLWESTRDKYLKMSNAPYMKVISAMMNNDLTTLVHTRPPKSWKETLALICTFAEGDEWISLCDALASNLMATGFTLAATLCYICAGNVDKTVDIWSRSLEKESAGKSYAESVQDLMEKTLVLTLATGNKRFSASLGRLFESYAEILASQGLLATAIKFLKFLDSGDFSSDLSILRNRIALYAEPEETTNPSASENTQPEISKPYQKNYIPPAPIIAQPSRTTFVPLNPPRELKNVDQYQHHTMDHYNFTRSMNPTYNVPAVPGSHRSIPSQVGPYLNYQVPQTVAPPVRPMTPTQQVVAEPAPAAPAPPPTVETADTSNVPAHLKPIVATLTRLFREISEPSGGGYSRANIPAKKREIEDNSKKLGTLFVKLNQGDISKNAAEKLAQLCQALDKHDFSAALQIQVLMTNTEWDECNFWLPKLKQMIRGRQNVR